MTERRGPIEARAWPDAIEAVAVDAGDDGVRLHGYDVERDLARHYRFSDVVYLALVGELPDDARSRAFEIVVTFLVPMPVARGPGHVAVLAGYCGASASALLGAFSATVADHAREVIVAALEPMPPLPEALRARSEAERASVTRLRSLLDGLVDVPGLMLDPSREAAVVMALVACGLRTELQLAGALALARIPSAVAEAGPRSSADFVEKYPMNTPPFAYVSEP